MFVPSNYASCPSIYLPGKAETNRSNKSVTCLLPNRKSLNAHPVFCGECSIGLTNKTKEVAIKELQK